MILNGRRYTITLVASDVSADQNAGRLAGALRKMAPQIRLEGAGGELLREGGVKVAVDSRGISMVGPPDSLQTVRALIHAWRDLTRLIKANPPDVVVMVDNENLNLLLARWLHKRGIRTVFFFPPQVWFWARWRLRWIVPAATRVLSAFKEEADLYRSAGAETIWVGHPLRDVVRVTEDSSRAVAAIGLDPARPLVVLMPGSREKELLAHCKLMLQTARILRQRDPRIQFAIPLAARSLRPLLEGAIRGAGIPDLVAYATHSFAVLGRARAVLQCAGTATLETGLLGIPSVIVYRCGPLQHFVARRAMHVKYIGMVNILLDDLVQPEFFHWQIDPLAVADEVWSLLTDETRRERIRARLATLPEIMGPPGAIERAAKAVLELLPGAGGDARSDRRRPTPDAEALDNAGMAASRS
jgi:lipid-A-disaccharide synthase